MQHCDSRGVVVDNAPLMLMGRSVGVWECESEEMSVARRAREAPRPNTENPQA